MATAQEIIAKVRSGETVALNRTGLSMFMRQCADLSLTCSLNIAVDPDGKVTISPPPHTR